MIPTCSALSWIRGRLQGSMRVPARGFTRVTTVAIYSIESRDCPIPPFRSDDSDVFSIIVDPRTSSRVYASACSGIYKSDNGGDLFHRVQGLPHSAIPI